MEKLSIQLARTPTVRLSCTFVGARLPPSPRETLIVYLNGIDNPQSMWFPTVSAVLRLKNPPPMLLYDRPGQGATTDRNPDTPGRPKGHGRDCLDAAHDLREVITQVAKMRLGIHESKIDSLRIVFVASSISCAIVRLYDIHYPGTISAFLLLDSTIANSDTVSIFPDPQAPGFSEESLPKGVTVKMIQHARKIFRKYYHPESLNKEGLWRGNLPDLLPHTDSPKIVGPRPGLPYITVMEHDPQLSPAGTEKLLGVSGIIIETYFDTHWHKYNEGLATLSSSPLSKGLIVAKGCGHLIHKDNPQMVADEIAEVLEKLGQDEASRI